MPAKGAFQDSIRGQLRSVFFHQDPKCNLSKDAKIERPNMQWFSIFPGNTSAFLSGRFADFTSLWSEESMEEALECEQKSTAPSKERESDPRPDILSGEPLVVLCLVF